MKGKLGLFWLSALLFGGCQSYDIVQRNIFVDEDGNVVTVDYGRSDKEHVNYFISPMTKKEMEFKSKLVLRVQLPDGSKETAWQCMNFLGSGTMYKTDNEEWMFLANGFVFTVFKQHPKVEDQYEIFFRGVLCDSPNIGVKKDERWKTVKPGAAKNIKEAKKK